MLFPSYLVCNISEVSHHHVTCVSQNRAQLGDEMFLHSFIHFHSFSFFPTLLARMLTRPEAVMFVIQSVACCSSPMRFFHLSPTVSLRSFPTRGRGPGPAPPLPLAPSLRVTLTSRYPWQAARTRWLAAVVGQWEKTFAWCPCSGPLFLWINLAHFYSCHFPLTLTVTQENNIHLSSV